MFDSKIVVPEYQGLIGWRQHHNINDIEIDVSLVASETGEFYQGESGAVTIANIQSAIPRDLPLDDYLKNVVDESVVEMFNDLLTKRQLKKYGKTLLENAILLNKYGWVNDGIVNQNRFVGFQIGVRTMEGLKLIIQQIGFQFVGASEFDLYLYHSSQVDPLEQITITATGGGKWDWKDAQFNLSTFNSGEYHGGVFILGYYQEDLVSQAINYSNFDWQRGECGSCNNNKKYSDAWKSIKNYYNVFPVYVPQGNFVKGQMFDMDKMEFDQRTSWGMNLRLSTICDLTDFFINNKFVFKNLLKLKVTNKVLEMMRYSQETNYIEENLKDMILLDLIGDKASKGITIPMRYQNELKSVQFNIENINSECLSCESKNTGIQYGYN